MFSINCLCRHSERMIAKLETAGLGFYVKQDKTAERLGKFMLCMNKTSNCYM